jgi:uncharacterized delta-60 repeat protein
MTYYRAFIIVAAALSLVFTSGLSAAAGDLDPTFGGGGKVATDFGRADEVSGVAVQADGKIVAAGYSRDPDSYDSDFVVARYNPNGSLDSGFGSGGEVQTDFGTSSSDAAYAVAVQPDGKIVAGGAAYIPDSSAYTDFALARYNPDGSLDSTFGGTGKVMTNLLRTDFATALAIQPDGKIVAVGLTRESRSPRDFDFAVVRYNPDGTLDAGFSGDGYDITRFSPSYDGAFSVLVQPDGRIVAAGVANGDDPSASQQVLIRYNGDGSLDGGFDGDGIVVGPEPGTSGWSVASQPDGKLLLGGGGLSGGSVTRYNSDGTIDTAFGSNGRAALAREAGVRSVLVQSDGKIVVAGTLYAPTGNDFLVGKLRPDGSPDKNFGEGGQMHTDFGTNSYDVINAAVLQSDRRILVAGSSQSDPQPQSVDFALARYQNPAPCLVPNVRGRKLARAKTSIRKAHCAVGKITRKPSRRVKKGRVLSQSPPAGAEVPSGSKVNLVVGKARRR